MQKYNHSQIERKWQAYWLKHKTFLAKDFSKKPKKYVLVEFPYPSGEGLHMGHLRPYVAGDVYSRFNRLKGFETLFPMGWDAFGLPAENYAIRTGVNPAITTKQNIKNAKKQMLSWGLSFDWTREINSTDPNYYKWTQWLFLQFYKAGLAYEATGLINWCPKDKTALANEEVIDGRCERCGTIVEKKEMRQWYLKITAYAEKLLEGLKDLSQWPAAVKTQQENWIGKSTGAEINFVLDQPGVKRFVLLHGRKSSPTDNFLPWLKLELEKKGFEVQVPALPNADEPNDDEQTEYVLDNCTLDENTVVVGHSFGGVVALRLLERGAKLNRVVLVSTPFSGKFLDGKVRKSVTAALKKGFDFAKIKQNSLGFTLLYDTSDAVVPMADGEAFGKNLGFGVQKQTGQIKHFAGAEEPEILAAALGTVKVFTTRPDTIFGATYLVVAPEHPLAAAVAPFLANSKEVLKYISDAKSKNDVDRSAEGKEKTGVELKGVLAINPASKEKIPVWIADYVLGSYGTGAIMAVPAHDERDFEFAKKYDLPINSVVAPTTPSANAATPPSKGGEAPHMSEQNRGASPPAKGEYHAQRGEGVGVFADYGRLINSGKFDGLTSEIAIPKMAAEFGKLTVQYKLRDWVFSRQRYWGEPIPIIHCEDHGNVPVPEKDLPVKLPPVKNYQPTGTGESPLADILNWVKTKCPICGKTAWRETNTMPQWAGSSWYWLRYTDPHNKKLFADKKKQKYWTPVDVYFGGMEHTTLHLLYSRFWNLFLYDKGLVTVKEPYVKRQPHGIILGADGEKMSKSRGNIANPDKVVKEFGADTLRMYELFLGPHEAMVSWNEQGVVGVKRFLDRVWEWAGKMQNEKGKMQNSGKAQTSDKAQRALHRLIKKVSTDLADFHFNTCVSAFMEFHNQIKDESMAVEDIKKFLTLLYPFAPHISEELFSLIGGKQSLQLETWPDYDDKLTVENTVEIVVQVNGKIKGKLSVNRDSTQQQVQDLAIKLDPVKTALVNDTVKRTIFVPNKLINLVI